MNAKFFLRDGRKMKLTPAGVIFLEEGKKILTLYSNMCHRISDVKCDSPHNLHIGISQFYGRFYLPYIMSKFSEQNPNVNFSIIEGYSCDLENMLLAGKLDVCLLPIYIVNDNLNYDILHQDEILLAIPPDSPLNSLASKGKMGKFINLIQLRSEPFIFLSQVQGFYQKSLSLCQENGFIPDIKCEVANWDTLNMLVREGVGVGFVNNLTSRSSKLVPSPSYYRIYPNKKVLRAYALVTRKQSSPPDIIEEFRDFVISAAAEGNIPNINYR